MDASQGVMSSFIFIFIAAFAIILITAVLIFFMQWSNMRNNAKSGNAQRSTAPCPLHGMTSTCLAAIHNDFPDFDYPMYRNKAQSLLLSYFTAVSTKNISALSGECSNSLKNYTLGIIYDLNARNVTQIFNNIIINDIQIARYIKEGKNAAIVFEISVGQYSYVIDRIGMLTAGSKERQIQTVYEVELECIQEKERSTVNGEAVGVNCPNCGAPIAGINEKSCRFCGTSVVEKYINSWKFSSVTENLVQRR